MYSDERELERIDDLSTLSLSSADLEIAGINLGGLEPLRGTSREQNGRVVTGVPRFVSGFIALRPGLNVCYGLNGSGKTRLLTVITQLAVGDHGPCEGFAWKFKGTFLEQAVGSYDRSPHLGIDETPSRRLSKVAPTRFWSEPTPQPATVDVTNENDEILREFAEYGSVLLTWPLNGSRRDHYVAVPVCERASLGPVTRRTLERMTELWLECERVYGQFYEAQVAAPSSDQDGDVGWKARETVREGLSAAWIQEFEGSVLYDARNFGDLLYREAESANEWWGLGTPDFAAGDSPLYLPAIAKVEFQPLALRVSGENRATQLDEAGEATRYGLVNKLGWADFERTIGRSRLPTDGTLGTAALGNIDLPRLEQVIIDQAATSWSESATSSIAKILAGSADLRCEAGTAIDWLAQSAPRWLLDGRPIAVASKAQLRWVSLVIQTVTLGPAPLLLVDEPESGVHRSAERAVASALAGGEWADVVIAATHSPIFLDQTGANLLRIDRLGGATAWKPEYYEQYIELGLTKSDMLTNVGLFLLVEGEHERVVLDALFGERFRELGVRVVPMRGGANVQHVVDSQFLFDCTDATVMVMLDNVAAASVREVWANARELAQLGELGTAREVVLRWGRNDPSTAKRNDARVWLTEFMTAAMTAGEHERVEVHGLAEPDLIYYMPPRPFVGGNSWARIKNRYADYTREGESAKKKPLSLKPWIERTYARDATSPEAFRAAAEEMDREHPPSDLVELLAHLEKILRS